MSGKIKCELEKMGDHSGDFEFDLAVATVAGWQASCSVL
jgi:hypothetical protein